jgi:hypothetical protein
MVMIIVVILDVWFSFGGGKAFSWLANYGTLGLFEICEMKLSSP